MVAKTCKKSWRETFGTIGVKFQRKTLLPGQNFSYFTLLVRSAGWHSAPVVQIIEYVSESVYDFAT